MTCILVADIGGTNARLGTVNLTDTPRANSNYLARDQQKVRCADYPDITSMIRAYIEGAGQPSPAYGCLAIAGPVQNGRVQMTNLSWEFGIDELRRELGLTGLEVINDFEALAYATPHLGEDCIKTLRKGRPKPDSPLLCAGPGTGFGMASLVPVDSRWQIVATEAGHCNFAPGDEHEIAILQHWLKHQTQVSVEDLVSGPGLLRIYRALAALAGQPARDYEPAAISLKGLSGEDPLCQRALDRFFAMLGSALGDMALSAGAQGGIFLGGGIAIQLADYLPVTEFFLRFNNKGPMSGYVEHIPIHVIADDGAALLGAAARSLSQIPGLTGEARVV